MNLISSLSYRSPLPSVVALGCFDGVHLGHTAVLSEARERATALGCACTVLTFTEPPRNFFSPRSVPLITDAITKRERIAALGADTLVCVPFSSEIAAMSAEDFFENILLDRLRACHIVCGYNYSFGAKGLGNTVLLEQLCAERGIGLSVLPAVKVGEMPVSSSDIRRAVMEGRPEDAQAMLGRPYALTATVVNGQHLARSLGFPTINQIFPDGMLIPRAGVYASRVTVEGESVFYNGISNVGIRPTVTDHTLCCETHLFDFSGDLYGRSVTVELLSFLRPERKFDSIDTLAEQVRADMNAAKKILKD